MIRPVRTLKGIRYCKVVGILSDKYFEEEAKTKKIGGKMKREKIFSVIFKGLPEMYFSDPKLAFDYAADLAYENGSEVDIRIKIKYHDREEIVKVMGVVCSVELGEIAKRFDDPEGKDRPEFIQALKEENQKGRLVFHKALRLERSNGESLLAINYEKCFEIFMEFAEKSFIN